ncbi:MAG: outer membrane protein assembly factor BamB family protein [Planctomycetota bacterium]
MRRLTILTCCSCFISLGARADDFASRREHNWHQWRGPSADGVAPHGNPPVCWDENTNVGWKVAVPGRGSSTPVVWEDRIFLTTAIETERTVDELPEITVEPPGGYQTQRPTSYYRFEVLCLDRRTGRARWRRTVNEEVPHEGHHPNHGYASASAVTDGRRVYVSFGSRGVYCLDVEGNLEWGRDLGDMVTRFGWGEAASPVLHGDALAVNWDHEGDSFLAVLDAATGDTRWKAGRDEISSWSTPLAVKHGDATQLVVSATRRVVSYDLASGKTVWECGGQTVNVIPSPVAADGVVYCMSGFSGTALYAIPLTAAGDLTGTDRACWEHHRGTPYVPSPLLCDGLLYFTKSNSPILSILSARSGEPLIDGARLPGLTSIYASPVAAAGRVYFVGRDGAALVVQQGPELKVLATNKLDDPIDASPAVVGRQMFLRGAGHLYCIEGDAGQ